MSIDLEKVREIASSHYRIENHTDREIDPKLIELVEQANLAEDLSIELESQMKQNSNLKQYLIEERARGNHYGMSYEDATDGEIERWIIDGEKDCPKFYLDRVRAEAKRQLITEGKI